MTVIEQTIADLWATGTSQTHPMAHVREALDERGAVPLGAVKDVPGDTNILVAGVVTHRQRPGTANGVIFFNLEDETGMLNVLCRPQIWERYRNVAFQAQGLLIHGRLERHDGAANLIATRLQRLPVATMTRSRDFR
jgi:error-prone DNA polymerase